MNPARESRCTPDPDAGAGGAITFIEDPHPAKSALAALDWIKRDNTTIILEISALDNHSSHSQYTVDRFRERQPIYYHEKDPNYSSDPMEMATQMVA